MRNGKWMIVIAVPMLCLATLSHAGTVSAAKAKKVTMNLIGAKTLYKYPAALDKAKKVSVKSSKKSVVKVKYKKAKGIRRIVLTAKKTGNATVTVKCRMKNKKVKTYKYKVKVVKGKRVTELDKAKEAFSIQNKYRKEKGVAALEWSDELYQFCLYRLKNSGFDGHRNLGRDQEGYFGLYFKYKKLLFAENLYSGGSNASNAMSAWKKSSAHFKNLLSSSHVCGAIACYKNVWCAIFYDRDKSEIENWRNYQIKEIKVRRFDNSSGMYIDGSAIGYYEVNNHWDSLQTTTITKTSGKSIYLEIGKTYIIYEKKTPNGYNKAERVTITVTDDGVSEVVLKGR